MKIVINRCYGGFGLSDLAYEKLIEWGVPRSGDSTCAGEAIIDRTMDKDPINHEIELLGRYYDDFISNNRTHILLVRLVEELGSLANAKFANLAVISIPDDVNYYIADFEGNESIHESHRVWL